MNPHKEVPALLLASRSASRALAETALCRDLLLCEDLLVTDDRPSVRTMPMNHLLEMFGVDVI
jgi:hypothetical protein